MSTTPNPSTPQPSAAAATKARKDVSDRLVSGLLSRMAREPGLESVEVTPLVVHEGEMMQVSHAELQALVNKNPKHPVAKDYALALTRTPAHLPLHVERIHIEALVDNKDIIIEEVTLPTADGKLARVSRKSLAPTTRTTSV